MTVRDKTPLIAPVNKIRPHSLRAERRAFNPLVSVQVRVGLPNYEEEKEVLEC
jgi:hypothetical protein